MVGNLVKSSEMHGDTDSRAPVRQLFAPENNTVCAQMVRVLPPALGCRSAH